MDGGKGCCEKEEPKAAKIASPSNARSSLDLYRAFSGDTCLSGACSMKAFQKFCLLCHHLTTVHMVFQHLSGMGSTRHSQAHCGHAVWSSLDLFSELLFSLFAMDHEDACSYRAKGQECDALFACAVDVPCPPLPSRPDDLDHAYSIFHMSFSRYVLGKFASLSLLYLRLESPTFSKA